MKLKSNPFLAAAFAVSLVSICPSSFGAQIYKDATTTDMNTVANWSTVFNAATPDPASIGTSDTLRFNEMFAPTSGTNYTASISADLTAGGIKLDFGSGGGGAPGTGNVIINGTNTLTLNGTLSGDSQYTGAIFVLNSGTGGSLTVNPNILIGAAGTQIVASRALNLNGTLNWGAFGMTNNIAGGTTTVAGVVSGSGNWSKSGGGTYYFSNTANTFSGTVTATGGTLKVSKLADGGSNSSLGAGSSTITLTGSTLEYAGTTTDSTNRSITMGGNATISNTGTGTVAFTAANVSQSGTASARTLTLTGTNTGINTFGSIIGDSGTGTNITALTKSGAGTWTLSGINTYTGGTNVTAGTLNISGSTNTTAGAVTVGSGSAGTLTVVDGGTLTTTGTLQLGSGTTTNAFNVNSGGIANVGTLNNSWGTDVMVNGTLNVTNSYTVATNAAKFIAGSGTINAASFSLGNAATTVNFTNTGAMNLTGVMTFAVGHSPTFNQSAGTVNTAGLALDGTTSTYTLTGGRINIGSSGIAGTGATRNINLGTATVGARADWSSALAMSLTDAATGTTFNTLDSVDNTTARSITLSGVLSGAGQLVKTGSGTLALSGANTYGGGTTLGSGTVRVATSDTALGSGTVTFSGNSTLATASGGGARNLANAMSISTGVTATLDSGFANLTIAGNIGGAGNLATTSTGTTILTGTNGYAGTTTVGSISTLRVNGSNTGTGAVSVAGRLEGTGSLAGAVNVTGTLAPGASIESLGTGALSFGAASTFAYELDSSVLNGDLANSTGTLDITAGSILTLTELASGTLAINSKLTLINYMGGWVNTELFTYLGNTLNDGDTFTLGANQWKFDYDDTTGGGNFASDQLGASSFVTMTVVPEPSAVLLGGLGVLCLLRRLRA